MSNPPSQEANIDDPNNISNRSTQNTYFPPGGGPAGEPAHAGVQNSMPSRSRPSSTANVHTSGPVDSNSSSVSIRHPLVGSSVSSSGLVAVPTRVRYSTAPPSSPTYLRRRATMNGANAPPTTIHAYRNAEELVAFNRIGPELRRRLRIVSNERKRMDEAKNATARLRAELDDEKEEVNDEKEELGRLREELEKEKDMLAHAQDSVKRDYEAIWSMDASIQLCNEKLQQLAEKEKRWGSIDKNMAEREESVEYREDEVFDREQEMHEKEAASDRREEATKQREAASEQRLEALKQKEKALADKEKAMQEKEQILGEERKILEEKVKIMGEEKQANEAREPEQKKRKMEE